MVLSVGSRMAAKRRSLLESFGGLDGPATFMRCGDGGRRRDAVITPGESLIMVGVSACTPRAR